MDAPQITERNSVRIAVALLALTEFAVMFDQWWHAVFTRDSNFIPPHYFVYGLSGALVLFSWYAWRRFKKQEWRRFGLLMTLLPISAPFDSGWHAWFGLENQNSVWVAWSPPHVILVFMFMFAQYRLFRLVQLYETNPEARKLLSLLLLALFISSYIFLTLPLQPLYYFREIGMAGYLITLPVPVACILFARRSFGFAGATLLSLFFYARVFAGSGESYPAYVPITPVWIVAAPAMLAALTVDAMPRLTSVYKQALAYGITFSLGRVGGFFLLSIGLYKERHFTVTLNYASLALWMTAGCVLAAVLLHAAEPTLRSHLFSRERVHNA